MKRFIAICGLDCEKCDAFIATKNDDQALREKTAKLWAELNNAPILPEHINCNGCRTDGRKRRLARRLEPFGSTIRRLRRTLKGEAHSQHTICP